MKIFIKGVLVALVVLVMDQWSKYALFEFLANKEYHSVEITSFFNLVMVRNYGVSFGMFNNIPYGQLILSTIALSICGGLCVWLYRADKTYIGVAIGLIIGGALGNVVDRVRLGAVADFLDFHLGEYHWPAFNIADSVIFIGVVILLLDSFFVTEKGKEND